VRVAQDLLAIARARDPDAAIKALTRRRGHGHDPVVVDAARAEPESLLHAVDVPDAWERVIDAEPQPVATISSAGLEMVARAFGEFADVKVDFMHGHSARVAELAATGAESLGCPRSEVAAVRAAGFFHDVGRVAVPKGIWAKPSALNAGERERVRLHPYYTERVLEHSAVLAPLARVAGSHHERLEGAATSAGRRRRSSTSRHGFLRLQTLMTR
jgi:HD-GYP domain-containing protein (c-di-GMP phosphodiesterase class II)